MTETYLEIYHLTESGRSDRGTRFMFLEQRRCQFEWTSCLWLMSLNLSLLMLPILTLFTTIRTGKFSVNFNFISGSWKCQNKTFMITNNAVDQFESTFMLPWKHKKKGRRLSWLLIIQCKVASFLNLMQSVIKVKTLLAKLSAQSESLNFPCKNNNQWVELSHQNPSRNVN